MTVAGEILLAAVQLLSGILLAFVCRNTRARIMGAVLLSGFIIHISLFAAFRADVPADVQRMIKCLDIAAVPCVAYIIIYMFSPGLLRHGQVIGVAAAFLAVLAVTAYVNTPGIFAVSVVSSIVFALVVIIYLLRKLPETISSYHDNYSVHPLIFRRLGFLIPSYLVYSAALLVSGVTGNPAAHFAYCVSGALIWVIIMMLCYTAFCAKGAPPPPPRYSPGTERRSPRMPGRIRNTCSMLTPCKDFSRTVRYSSVRTLRCLTSHAKSARTALIFQCI